MWNRSVIVTYGDEQVFDIRQGQDSFLYFTRFTPLVGPTQALMQWIPRVLSPTAKRPERETTHLFLMLRSRKTELYLLTSSQRDAFLVKL
jgi:hypothetical protein